MRRATAFLATLALLGLSTALAPPGPLSPLGAAAADHDGFRVVTSTDFEPGFPPVVGVPAEVSYYALEDGAITGHHNAIVALATGGVPLATLPFTHEHDSIFNALVTPARPGPLHVDIQLPPLDGGAGHPEGHTYAAEELLGHGTIHAEAVPLVPAAEATLTVAAEVVRGGSSTLTFHLADAAGEPLVGYVLATLLTSDLDGGAPDTAYVQAKLSAKEGQAALRFLAAPGATVLRAMAWPSLHAGPRWAPVTLEQDLEAAPPLPEAPAPRLPPPEALLPAAAAGHAHQGAHLYVSADPAPANWVFQQTRLNLVAMGSDMLPLRHADVKVAVLDALGRTWFSSEDLHEPDGMAQVDLFFPFPGRYVVVAEATPMGGEALAAERWFEVRAQGTNALPAAVVVEAPEALAVGAPAALTLGLHRLGSGEAVPHTDYWLRVLHEGRDVLQTKIHTHQGDATPSFAPPWPGSYEVRVAAYPQAGGFAGSANVRVLQLGAEGALPDPEPVAPAVDSGDPAQRIPGPGAAALLLALSAGALVLGPRRRGGA